MVAEPSLLEWMGVGAVLYAVPKNLSGIRKLRDMNDKNRIQFKIIMWLLYLWITFTIFWNYFT